MGFCSVWAILAIAFAVGSTVFGIFWLKAQNSPNAVTVPQPPKPYDYDGFMAWLTSHEKEFAHVDAWKWKPNVAEFDTVAPAESGKFSQHLQGKGGETAVAAAKHINKFLLMGDIMRTGDIDHIGSPGMLLYILRKLAVSSAARELPQPTFLDAGCGPGFLLLAWSLICGPGSKAIGIDMDAETVQTARQYVASPDAVDVPSRGVMQGSTINVYKGNALQPDATELGLMQGSVDAVNLGFAVRSVSDLQTLATFLVVDGLLLAPMCIPPEEQPKDIPAGKCQSLLRMYSKDADGNLVRVPGDEIPVRFVVASTMKTNLRR